MTVAKKKPAKAKSNAQEPLENFRRPKRERTPADDQVEDPNLPGLEEDQEPIPHLEKKFKLMQSKQDEAKRIGDQAKALEEECLLILHDHGLSGKPYKRGRWFIFIDPGKPHVKGHVDD